jgi:hypothetical protein
MMVPRGSIVALWHLRRGAGNSLQAQSVAPRPSSATIP